jgi:hypothetical protein
MDGSAASALPLHIAVALQDAEKACAGNDAGQCHTCVMRLAEAIVYHLGAVAVAQYSQALYTGQIEADPTLNRSLRSLRRLLPGQWLGWTARGLESTPEGPVAGLREWYTAVQGKDAATAYETLRSLMVERLDYLDEHGPREEVSPRALLELVDQYRIKRGKASADALSPPIDREVGEALLAGLHEILESASFLRDYPLYAPQQRQLLMGLRPTTPMPPISAPGDVAAAATILLYPPGEAPDYTKRPNLQKERVPLFPLDPLLIYIRCPECERNVVAALREVVMGEPLYLGLDPRCEHNITLRNES